MADVVSATEAHKALLQRAKPSTSKEEFVWQAAQQMPSTSHRRPVTANKGTSQKCYNCLKGGHTRKNCPMCSFCKELGHTAKNCQKRITQSKGKYCTHCKLADSHSLSECRKIGMRKRNVTGRNVREVRSADEGAHEPADEYYDPNILEGSDDLESS